MGFYDREYYRDEYETRGIQLGGQAMVTKLVLANVAVFLLDILISGSSHWLIYDYLAIRGDTLVKPWLWFQFLTYGFCHNPADNWHLIGNMLGLWFLGRAVEGVYGQKEFLRFYVAALLIGSVSWTLINFFYFGPSVDPATGQTFWRPMLGASGAVTAVIMLFVFHFPKQTILLFFVLPVPAWVLGLMIIAYNLFALQGPSVAYEVHMAGCIFAACYYRFHWNIGRMMPNFRGGIRLPKRSRPELKIHDPDAAYDKLDREADRLLEKVNKEGIESLTAKERRVLEDYSRRMRQKHR